MPIPVKCQCGAGFAAGDHLAGKTVQCPQCKNPLAIPTPAAATQAKAAPDANCIFEAAGIKSLGEGQIRCPSCEAMIASNAVICVKCGLHLQTGKKVAGANIVKKTGDAHADVAEDLLEKARLSIEKEKHEKAMEGQEGMPWWMLGGIFLFATAFLCMMLILQGDIAFYAGGAVIILTSSIALTYFNIRIIMAAFEDNLTQGLLYCFAPGYAFYYMFIRWDKCGPNFVATCLASVAMGVGIGMIAMAPLLKPAEDDKAKNGAIYSPRTEWRESWASSDQPPAVHSGTRPTRLA